MSTVSGPPSLTNNGSSTRPYLVRALHDWCTDNGFTPYIAVQVDAGVKVPLEYVKNSEIVLNIGFEATSGLKLGNDWIEFSARFGGSSRDIQVPVDHVIAIYARENGQGMAFPSPTRPAASASAAAEGVLNGQGPERVGGGLRLAASDTGLPAEEPRPAPELVPATPPPEPPEGSPPAGRPSLKRIK